LRISFDQLRSIAPTTQRRGPFERAKEQNAIGLERWYLERRLRRAQPPGLTGLCVLSFREFPSQPKPGIFNLDRVLAAAIKSQGSGN
jgi:arylsulfatase